MVAGEVGHAYPLRFVSFDGFETTYDLVDGAEATLTEAQREAFARFEPAWAGGPTGPAAARPAVKLGHPNFAHQAWNELGALVQAREIVDLSAVDIDYTFDPLGVVEALFGDAHRCVKASAAGTEVRAGGALFTQVGGLHLGAAAARAIIDHARKSASQHARAMANHVSRRPEPKIWLTMRRRGRGCENQQALYLEIARQLKLSGVEPCFLLDGFSRPQDFDTADYDAVRDAFAQREAECKAEASALIDALNSIGLEAFSLIGWPLLDALALSAEADFYISHIGTLHHKIGWFNTAPGWINAGPASIRPGLARWHANQSDLAVEPAVPEPDWMKEHGRSAHHPEADRNMDYAVRDVLAFAQAVVRDLIARFGERRTASGPKWRN